MILFQVRDLAAKSCGEPHVAPSWDIAKASLGSLLAKTPELAERAHSLKIEYIGEFDPETGYVPFELCSWDAKVSTGDICLAEFLAACRKEEDQKQEEADRPLEVLRKSVDSVLKEQADGEPGKQLFEAVSEFEKERHHE